MTPADISTAPDWSFRADEAARSVTRLFGQRLFFLPGTHIAAIVRPSGRLKNLARPWHYWWQAHYVDCLVDTGRRELGTDGRPGARFDGADRPSAGRLASRLVTGHPAPQLPHVRQQLLRRHGLAGAVHAAAGEPRRGQPQEGRAPPQRQGPARASRCSSIPPPRTTSGGGTFWSKKRDFKNTPATAPVALYYARTGQAAKAQALLDWLDARLFDPEQGLYRDGLRIAPGGDVVLESAIYTYNQGPVLGALLELGGEANLARAAALVAAVARSLTLPAPAGGAQRHGAALRGHRRRRPVHRHPRPVPGPRRRRRAASAPRPGRRPRRSSTTPPRPSGRAAASAAAGPARPARAAGSVLRPPRTAGAATPTRRAPPSNFPPSCRPGWYWKRPPIRSRQSPAGSTPIRELGHAIVS